MRKTIAIILTAVLMVVSMTGCIKTKADGAATELSMKGIRSMAVDGHGTVYLLTDDGLRKYTLSGDKKLDYAFDSSDMDEAKFSWIDRGEKVEYSDFQPESLIANGETGLQFLAVYRSNDLGRDSNLFVVQDILDMNYSAAYFNEIESGDPPTVNGIGVTEKGLFIKLNRPYTERHGFDGGVHFEYNGYISAIEMPDGVIGAMEAENEVFFLTKNNEIISGDEVVFSFEGNVVTAFVSGDGAYAIYPDGKVIKWTAAAGQESFAELGIEISEAGDPFIWDGNLYWYDKDGVKAAKI